MKRGPSLIRRGRGGKRCPPRPPVGDLERTVRHDVEPASRGNGLGRSRHPVSCRLASELQHGAHATLIRTCIRDAWADAGWEAGALGYPISDEYAVTGGRRSDFEHGSITWTADTDTSAITLDL